MLPHQPDSLIIVQVKAAIHAFLFFCLFFFSLYSSEVWFTSASLCSTS